MEMISRYIVVMYNQTSNSADVNEARRTLFVKDGQDLDLFHLQNQLFLSMIVEQPMFLAISGI